MVALWEVYRLNTFFKKYYQRELSETNFKHEIARGNIQTICILFDIWLDNVLILFSFLVIAYGLLAF